MVDPTHPIHDCHFHLRRGEKVLPKTKPWRLVRTRDILLNKNNTRISHESKKKSRHFYRILLLASNMHLSLFILSFHYLLNKGKTKLIKKINVIISFLSFFFLKKDLYGEKNRKHSLSTALRARYREI